MRWYLSQSVGDCEGFRPAEATRCTDIGEVWRGGVRDPRNSKSQAILEYKRPTAAYPLGDFYKIFSICKGAHELLKLKIG